MKLHSPVFEDGGEIPARYSYYERNEAPPLEIRDVPEAARSLLLIFEDLDSPLGPLTHWIVWNLPPDVVRIDARDVPESRCVGTNGYGSVGYDGPCPPAGRHRYRFLLLALDTLLDAGEGATRSMVESKASAHVLAEAALTGYFELPQADAEGGE